MPNTFADGYRSAKHFYGDGARYALDQIGHAVAQLRAAYPTLPAAAEVHIAHIEAMVTQDRRDVLPGEPR